MIRFCLPSQSASENQEKSPQTFAHLMHFSEMCLPCLIIIQSYHFDCRINKPFTCSRCVICVSCSVHVISTYDGRKGSWTFYLNYPQFKEVENSDDVDTFLFTFLFVNIVCSFFFIQLVLFIPYLDTAWQIQHRLQLCDLHLSHQHFHSLFLGESRYQIRTSKPTNETGSTA